ncbi:MAG: hypothetical protein QXQ41_04455 [Candidatus Bathyarchaeia archaeon]
MSEVKKAIITFNYAEKIKSSLIIASGLIEQLGEINDSERAGAEKLLYAYFNALATEVNMAANATKLDGFRGIALKLEEAMKQVKERNYAGASRLISEAISLTTTQGSPSAKMLNEMGLI